MAEVKDPVEAMLSRGLEPPITIGSAVLGQQCLGSFLDLRQQVGWEFGE